MRIFGTILPFLGFREFRVDNAGERCAGRSHWKADLLVLEWLGFGWVLARSGIRPG